jgi:putative SOS response-associated peptidase YedK
VIALALQRPMVLAGLYDPYLSPSDRTVRSVTIVATTPNALVAELHDHHGHNLRTTRLITWLHVCCTGMLCARDLVAANHGLAPHGSGRPAMFSAGRPP